VAAEQTDHQPRPLRSRRGLNSPSLLRVSAMDLPTAPRTTLHRRTRTLSNLRHPAIALLMLLSAAGCATGTAASAVPSRPATPAPAAKDADRAVALEAVKKYYPALLSSPASSPTPVVYVLVGPDGRVIGAARGGLEAYQDLKLQHHRTDADVQSLRIVNFEAGSVAPGRFEVAVARMRR
jgi:hypothetical protein